MIDWSKYEARVEACEPKILKAMLELAERVGVHPDDVWIDEADDWGVVFPVRNGDESLDVQWYLWDSGDAADGIYGVHGNFVFDLMYEGRLIAGLMPENYTDKVWVDYEDDDEWNARFELIKSNFEYVVQKIEEWRK